MKPIYVAEVSPPAIRGRLIGSYEMCWQIGGAIGFWINYGASTNLPEGHTQWLIAFAVQLIVSLFPLQQSTRLIKMDSPVVFCSSDLSSLWNHRVG